FAQRGIVPNPVVMQMNAQTPAVDVTRLVRRLALPAALVLALFIALAVSSGWMPVLQFLNQTPFGVTDPVFGRDLGYYVFTLPIIGGVLGLLMFLVVVALLASGALYALRGDVVIYRKNLTIEPSARLHLALLLAVLFVASYANLHGTIIGLKLAGLAALVGVALVVAGARSKRLGRNALLAVAIYFGVSLLGVVVYPAVVQRLIVAPNELNKETPQLI